VDFVQLLNEEESASRNEWVLVNIPADVMVRMVRISIFPKLPCRTLLASTNKPLQKLIFQYCIPLWREINVPDLPYTATRIFTDDMLSSLLIRVNAKSVTRTISVKDCKYIRGTALEPLRGSQVLEFSRGIDLDTVLPILRTMMILVKLFHLRLSLLRGEAEVFTSFLRDLRDA
jgi:hypothetical protein